MNDFGMTVLRSAVQVTLVALPASALVLWAARRGAASAVAVATTALAILALVTAVAFCPLPAWWSWQPAPAAAAATTHVTTERRPEAIAPTPPGIAVGLDWLSHLRRLPALMPGTVRTPEARSEQPGWSALAVAFLFGIAGGFGRLLLGLWAVSRCRRRSRPIADAGLLALADELRAALGGRRPVELRESDEVGTAATVGWRRPAVLLAPDWPAWTDAERRGVLAHELSHACRQDYLTGLFARGCVALHFYHPLVRWLAGRLRLHQELAADAAAARCAGGHGPYLTALARMALRQDAGVRIGPALPFLSGRGTLLRRVAMLRVTDDVRRPLSGAGRAAVVVLLIGIGCAATALRGPAQDRPAAAPANVASELPPFDLTHVPASANSIIAVRPAAVFARPDMKEVADRLNRQLAEALRTAGLPVNVHIPLHEIEQVVCGCEGKLMTPPPGREWQPGEAKNALLIHSLLVRMTHDFDWPALSRSVAAALKAEVREVRPGLFRFGMEKVTLFFLVPDRRTICLLEEGLPPAFDRYDELLARFKAATPAGVTWGPAWSKVERCTAALALDNRKGYWIDSFKNSPEGVKVAELLGQPTHLVGGLDLAETVTGRVFMTGADEAATRQTLQGIKALAALGQVRLKVASADDEAGRSLLRVYGELLGDHSVRQDGTTATAEFRSPTRLVDLSKLLDFGDLIGK